MRKPSPGLGLVLAASAAMAQSASDRTVPRVLTYISGVDGSEQPYTIYVPKNLDPGRRYPLLVALHGEGSNDRVMMRTVFGRGPRGGESDLEASRFFPSFREVDFFVVCPFARGSLGYDGIGEAEVYQTIDEVKRRFPVDEDRVYLTGVSRGGEGALRLALTRPDFWAAAVPVCPLPAKAAEVYAANGVHVPVRLFHGESDPLAPVSTSRLWHKLLLNAGGTAEYMEFPLMRHNAWDAAYRDASLFDWLKQFRRNRHPDRARLVTNSYRYNSSFFLRIDALSPGTPALVDAQFTGENKILISTRDCDGFSLRLQGHPKYAPNKPLTVSIDGAPVKVVGTPSFTRVNYTWRAARAVPAAYSKRQGAEGPLAEAIASRHVYVYGTRGTAAQVAAWRQQALQAADWSMEDYKIPVSFPVRADDELTDYDLYTANIVLFGTKETNSVLARFARQLPLAFNPSAADYGLIYIFPVGDRYFLVNSGVNWWTGAGRNTPPHRLLAGLEDYALYKGSLNNLIESGRFDRDWKLKRPFPAGSPVTLVTPSRP